MADISITAANVLKGSNALIANGTAGAAVTAGQCVYRDPTTGRFLLSDCDGANSRQVTGVALHGAATGQPLEVQTGGDITIGATVTAGAAYYLSPNPGGICLLADVASGDDPILIGMAKSASVLTIRIIDPNVTI